MDTRIELGHGSGGIMTRELIKDVFLRYFDNEWIRQETDSAVIDVSGKTLAFTTDSYVISPLFFPGGDIGKLSVCGTVNDLAVTGADPAWLTAGFILEEGLPLKTLEAVVKSMKTEADKAGVSIVAGDTKVVGKGQADGMYIITSGIGFIDNRHKNIANGSLIKPSDVLIVNGTMGDHEAAIINTREGFFGTSRLKSDCNSLNGMIAEIMVYCRTVHFMRDITRGGLAGILSETAGLSKLGIVINEIDVPFNESVTAFCEALGYDPLHFANEGKCIIIVTDDEAGDVLSIMHNHVSGRNAAKIGKVTGDHPGKVVMETIVGGRRIVEPPRAAKVPRIC
jgi:hydrogenase expression/formation protein HypE